MGHDLSGIDRPRCERRRGDTEMNSEITRKHILFKLSIIACIINDLDLQAIGMACPGVVHNT